VLATAAPAVERLLMIPTFRHPFGKSLEPYEDRVAMCEQAASIFGGRVEVSRIEQELGGESYTLRTVEALRERHPDTRLSLIIGADLLEERVRWHGWERLSTLIDFIVVGRTGAAVPVEARDELTGLELPAVSSTDVRRRLAEGGSLVGLVDVRVRQHIELRGLYRPRVG
jgi:nicotinate-nucleotide adenylyltransferase